MARLQTIKPMVQMLDTRRVKMLQTFNHYATERTRGRAWMERRAKWLRANPLCCACEAAGYVTVAEEVDHITPLWAGGLDDESNYQSLCRECHAAKTEAEAKIRAAEARG